MGRGILTADDHEPLRGQSAMCSPSGPDGEQKYRMLNVVDEFTHEAKAIRVKRKVNSVDVNDVLSELFLARGVPGHILSGNCPEFVAKAVRRWIAAAGAKTEYIGPGSPWENGYVESFNARLRDELLDGEIFYTLREAQIVIESWCRHCNEVRPHIVIGNKPPVTLIERSAARPPQTGTGREI